MISFFDDVCICIIYLLLSLSGMTFIKLGHSDVTGVHLPFVGMISVKLIIGGGLYGLGFLFFVFFVSKLRISVAIPVVSGIYCMFTVILGTVVFKEKISREQIVGMAMVILGTIVLGVFKD